jgi:uncharacterized protein YbjT (DUF2867 family)
MSGVHTAYYLVRSLTSTDASEKDERRAARNFANAAKEAAIHRIIYLGTLGSSEQNLSCHLRTRQEVGEILRSCGVSVIELRASTVIGSGSVSFEMFRALVDRLPLMLLPRWVTTTTQPIGVEDVIACLVATLDLANEGNRTFEIGGPDRVSYGDIMREYARQRGLRRIMIPVPHPARLSGLWMGLITPIYARVARTLIDTMQVPSIVRDESALKAFPIRPKGIRETLERARWNEDQDFAETRWIDALSSTGVQTRWGGVRFGSRIVESRSLSVDRPREMAFKPIRRIGGTTGWYYGDWLWRLRGFIDLLMGGVGLRRGRRDPEFLCVGDTVDFWRVEAFEEGRKLLLAAEMKLPGRAWLEFEVEAKSQSSTIRQTAIFDPVGLLGLAYWYLLYPIHHFVFSGMIRGIADASRREEEIPSRTA